MPIRYRHYHIKKIVEFLERQNEEVNKNQQTLTNTSDKVQVPDFVSKVKAPKN